MKENRRFRIDTNIDFDDLASEAIDMPYIIPGTPWYTGPELFIVTSQQKEQLLARSGIKPIYWDSLMLNALWTSLGTNLEDSFDLINVTVSITRAIELYQDFDVVYRRSQSIQLNLARACSEDGVPAFSTKTVEAPDYI